MISETSGAKTQLFLQRVSVGPRDGLNYLFMESVAYQALRVQMEGHGRGPEASRQEFNTGAVLLSVKLFNNKPSAFIETGALRAHTSLLNHNI